MEKATSRRIVKNISVVCPYRNEELMLPLFRPIAEDLAIHGAEIIFINSRSADTSRDIVDSWQFPKKNLNLDSPTPSIGQAVLEASHHSTRKFVVILPVDIWLYADQLIDLENHIERNEKIQWGAFYKQFKSLKWHYRLYSWIQNEIRLKIFRRAVWTNVIFARKEHIIKFLSHPQGFMEDTQLSDGLHYYDFVALDRKPVIVSDRKFRSNAKFQMIKNIIILVLYRLKVCSLETLKKIYSY